MIKISKTLRSFSSVLFFGFNVALIFFTFNTFGQTNDGFRYGKLENGLSYFIIHDKSELNRVEFVFSNKAGNFSVSGDDLGFPHLVEHIGFRGTRNFPGGLRKYFQAHGLVPGVHIGGNTDITTNYKLSVPINDSVLFESAFLALHDWANGMLFLPDEIVEERSAVTNEFLKTKDSMFQSLLLGRYLCLDSNLLYSHHNLATMEINNANNASVESLKTFYKKWYTPDREAIIIRGDVNLDKIENKIKTEFTSLKGNGIKMESWEMIRKKYNVPLIGKNKLVVVNHGTGNPQLSFKIYKKRKPDINIDAKSRSREKGMEMIYNQLLVSRLGQFSGLERKTRYTFKIVRDVFHDMAAIDAMSSIITFNNFPGYDSVRSSIEFAARELYRIEKWGFSQLEFSRAREEVKLKIKLVDNNNNSSLMMNTIYDCFVKDCEDPNLKGQYFISEVIDQISLKDFNQFSTKWTSLDKNVVVLGSFPGLDISNLFSEEKILSWIANIRNEQIDPYEEKIMPEKVLPTPFIKNSENYRVQKNSKTGIVRIVLKNGVTVILNRIGSRVEAGELYNEISIRGFTNKHPELFAKYPQGVLSASAKLVNMSGLSSLNYDELKSWEKSKNKNGYLSVATAITEDGAEINADGNLNNFHNLLDLIYYYIAEPRIDSMSLASFKKESLASEPKTRLTIFNDSIISVLGGQTLSVEKQLKDINQKYLYNIYKAYFSNPADFTFVITGYFETSDIIDPIVKYLGALVNTKIKNSPPPQELPIFSFPKVRKIFMMGDSIGNANVKIFFPIQKAKNFQQRLKMTVLNRLIDGALFDRLREKERGVYDIKSYILEGKYDYLKVEFETTPENIDRLVRAASEELELLLRGTIHESSFIAARNIIEQLIILARKSSVSCAADLVDQIKKGSKDPDPDLKSKILKTITLSDFKRYVTSVLTPNDYLLFVLF